MTDDEKIRRGERAHALMTDPLMVEAYEAVETALIDRWRACPDQAERERIWLSQALLRKLWGHLEHVVATGKIAEKDLDDLLAEERRRKRFRLV